MQKANGIKAGRRYGFAGAYRDLRHSITRRRYDLVGIATLTRLLKETGLIAVSYCIQYPSERQSQARQGNARRVHASEQKVIDIRNQATGVFILDSSGHFLMLFLLEHRDGEASPCMKLHGLDINPNCNTSYLGLVYMGMVHVMISYSENEYHTLHAFKHRSPIDSSSHRSAVASSPSL